MKYKLSVIFLFICLILILIYNMFDESKMNVLYIGDNNTFNYIKTELNEYNLSKYLFNNVTYTDIYKYIKNNHYKFIKDSYVYLNQEIGKSDVIILNANNFEYKLKCKKNNRIIQEYNNKVYNDIQNLVLYLKSIVDAKIIVIGNYCNGNNIKFDDDKYYFINYNNIENIDEILSKVINN